jgi:hypothetical protein
MRGRGVLKLLSKLATDNDVILQKGGLLAQNSEA